MRITINTGKWKTSEVEALFVPMARGEKPPKGLPKLAEQLLNDAIKNKEFSGKADQQYYYLLPTGGKKGLRYVFFLGLGKPNKIKAQDFGENLGRAIRKAQSMKAKTGGFWFRDLLALHLGEVEHLSQVIAEYAAMSAYEFSDYLKKKKPQMKSLNVYVENKAEVAAVKKGVSVGQKIAQIVNESRGLANTPSNEMTPVHLAEFAKETAKKEKSIKVRVMGEKEMRQLGMGAILGVSKGSAQEAQFIIAEYHGGSAGQKPYVIVGKGITFDTGGISIKPSKGLEEMKYDMCGGAAALAAIRSVAALKLPVNVAVLVPTSENMLGQSAYKPGDVLKALDGTTIEVINTDAEGRLLLADALVYARKYKPQAVIDLATLTGACAVALYDSAAGLFTHNDEIAQELQQAGERTGDIAWRLPLPKRYRKLLRSKVADIGNIANIGYGGALTAAAFLDRFVDDKYPWAHLDIAGVAWASGAGRHLAPGSTGAGIRVIVEWLRQRADK